MVPFSAIMSAVTLASTCSVAKAERYIGALPWDGRADDLTVETLSDKYMMHNFVRNDTSLTVADYITIDQKGRRKGYNCDEGVFDIGVDDGAIKEAQTDFRRSDLMQFVAKNKKGKTFFRTSFRKEEAFVNKQAWQMIFDELHYFEIRIDATLDTPMLMYINNGTWDAKWQTEFVPGTWYNFGVAVSAAFSGKHELEFYTSEGDEDLVLMTTHLCEKELPGDFEFHFGLLTPPINGRPVPMVEEQDIVSFNGVSVTADVTTAAGTVASPFCQ